MELPGKGSLGRVGEELLVGSVAAPPPRLEGRLNSESRKDSRPLRGSPERRGLN